MMSLSDNNDFNFFNYFFLATNEKISIDLRIYIKIIGSIELNWYVNEFYNNQW